MNERFAVPLFVTIVVVDHKIAHSSHGGVHEIVASLVLVLAIRRRFAILRCCIVEC
jgi:hypothetical protein